MKKKKSTSKELPETPSLEPKDSTTQVKEKKKMRLSSILTMVGVISLGVVSGTAIGLWFKSRSDNGQDPIDDDLYRDNMTQILTKWEESKRKGVTDYSSTLSATDMIQIGFSYLEENDYLCEGFGLTKAGTLSTQYITSIKAKKNHLSYFESISGGQMVKIGSRYVEKEDHIDVYDASKVYEWKDNVYLAEYKEKVNAITKEDFEAKFGSPISAPTDYILSSKTIKEDVAPSIKKENSNYIVDAEFGDNATVVYKTKIKATEDKVTKVNYFPYVQVQCVLDEDLRILQFNVKEKYEMIAMQIAKVTCDAYLNTTYYYDITEEMLPIQNEAYQIRGEIEK